MKRTTRIQTEFADEIGEAVTRFGDHEDMNEARLIRWLDQFADEDLPLALRVIRAVLYLNGVNIRTMTRQLFDITVEELNRRVLGRAGFVAVGSLGAGSGTVARVLRDMLRATNHSMLSMLDVSRLQPGDYDAIVFVDDFSGTGDSLKNWWQTVEPLVRPTNTAVIVSLLVLNERAYDEIRSFAEVVVAVTELDGTANKLSPESPTFTEDEKPRISTYCQQTGCGPFLEAGYGQCGLLLAFKHGCPDNSLPILWFQDGTWRPLFNRRAI